MLSYLSRLFQRKPAVVLPAGPPPWATELADQIANQTEVAQKLLRAQARIALQIDELQSRLDAGLQDLRKTAAPAAVETTDWTHLLDALDRLDDVVQSAHASGAAEFGLGLQHIADRLHAQLRQDGLERRAALGRTPDARLVRVVATDARDDVPAGTVTRVVRAAVTRGAVVVREGEVVVSTAQTQGGSGA